MKKIIIFCLLIFISAITTGCLDMIFGPVEAEDPVEQGKEEVKEEVPESDIVQEDSWEIVLYCIDKTTNLLVPVTVDVPKQEGVAKATVEKLVLGNSLSEQIAQTGLEMPLPQRTEVLGISINDGTARVDLSKEFMAFRNDRHEVLGVTSLVYTLTQFPTIERVQIVVNGEITQKLIYDTYVKVPIDRTLGINISVNDNVDLKENTKVTNYYPVIREGKTLFIPETKVINQKENILDATLVEYFKGPNTNLLFNSIPTNVEVLEGKKENDTVLINLSKEFMDIQGINERSVVDSLILTLGEIDEIKRVKIFVEGEDVTLEDGTDLSEILSIPKFPKIP